LIIYGYIFVFVIICSLLSLYELICVVGARFQIYVCVLANASPYLRVFAYANVCVSRSSFSKHSLPIGCVFCASMSLYVLMSMYMHAYMSK